MRRTSAYLKMVYGVLLAVLAQTSLAIPNKGLILAVNLEGLIDCSNLIDLQGGTQGAVYDVARTINSDIVATINRHRSTSVNNLSFSIEPPLHMTFAYIGYLDDTDVKYNHIVQDLKENVERAIRQWNRERINKGPLKAKIDTIMWPPLGRSNVWLTYRVQIADENKDDFLNLLNRIQSMLLSMNQEWYGAIRDVTDNQKMFRRYKSLDAFKGHVSLGRFDRPYTINKVMESAFGLPARYKEPIDIRFNALPAPLKPDFEIAQVSLFIKDIASDISRVDATFSLSAPVKKVSVPEASSSANVKDLF